MEPSWKHEDVFPIIADIIEELYREHQRFITHPEIKAQLLRDARGRNQIEAACEKQENKPSHNWQAGNMVAWFSKCITEGTSEWTERFERKKPKRGGWTYRPTAAVNPKDGSRTD